MVQVAVAEEDPGDRRMARPAWPQPGEALDLLPDLRRSVQQEPVLAVVGNGHALLRAGGAAQGSFTKAAAVRAAAVPLGKAAAGGRPQDPEPHRESRLAGSFGGGRRSIRAGRGGLVATTVVALV